MFRWKMAMVAMGYQGELTWVLLLQGKDYMYEG